MQDTSPEMLNKQREIIFSKKPSERFLIGVDAINFGRMMIENNIRQMNPGISELDLKIAVLKRYYENVFDEEEFQKIINSLKKYYEKH